MVIIYGENLELIKEEIKWLDTLTSRRKTACHRSVNFVVVGGTGGIGAGGL